MEVANYVHEQSADIAVGVDASGNKDEGAGDQGIMFGLCVPRDQGSHACAHSSVPCNLALSRGGAPLRSRAWIGT